MSRFGQIGEETRYLLLVSPYSARTQGDVFAELRDFPKAIWANKSFASLTNNCLRGLANCTTLQSCSWTRDSTLTNEILDVLSSRCSHLKELEINGNSTSAYNPEILLQFTSLAKISLIMPSVDVINILPTWLRKTGETLTAFNVLCKVCQPPLTCNILSDL